MKKIDNFLWADYPNPELDLKETYFTKNAYLKKIRLIQLIFHSIIPLFYIFSGQIFYSFKYLTIISMYMVFIYHLLINICTSYQFKDKSNEIRLKKITIIMFELSFSLEFTVTFFFWLILYPHLSPDFFNNSLMNFLIVGIYMHSILWISLWIDLVFNTIIFHVRHFHVLLVVLLVYGVFNFCYKMASGRNLYPVIKWEDWWTIFYLLVALLMTIFHFMVGLWFSQYKHRNWKTHSVSKKD